MTKIKEDSLKKRYFYKLSTNLINIPIALITEFIIPRGLGPKEYGNFSFLANFFTRTIGFFDSGTSMAFYTKLSQRNGDKGLIRFYWIFVFLASIILTLILPLIFFFKQEENLWPNQQVKFIWLGLIYGLLNWLVAIVSKIVDAYGLTAKGELIRMFQKILGLVSIGLLFFTNQLTLTSFFLYHYSLISFVIIGWIYILRRENLSVFPNMHLSVLELKSYFKEFYEFTHPLITFAFISFIIGILDIWLLQKFAGSVEQGFYGLAYKIASVCFLFASAMTPLITREFSIAFGKKDVGKMRQLFKRYIPMLYLVIAFFSIFLAINAGIITTLFGGQEFQGATLAVTIMAFYPIHQTYGQLSGSVFYATGDTKLYRNLRISTKMIGLPLTLILLFPKSMNGLALGSIGLALKMIILQYIGVNLQLWFNAKKLNMSFKFFFFHQIVVALCLLICASFSFYLSLQLFSNSYLFILGNGVIYSVFTALLVLCFPQLASISREELLGLLKKINVK